MADNRRQGTELRVGEVPRKLVFRNLEERRYMREDVIQRALKKCDQGPSGNDGQPRRHVSVAFRREKQLTSWLQVLNDRSPANAD